MAVWQYSFWGLPEKKLLEVYGEIPHEIDEDTFNSIPWFEGVDQGLIVGKINFLLRSEHWSKDAMFWGDFEKDSITLWTEGGAVSELSFRVDLRSCYKNMTGAMLELLAACDFVLVREDLVTQTYDADFVEFLEFVALCRNIKGG